MGNEVDAKIETIIISVVNRLYKTEEVAGLNEDDLKCFEIICKIKKDYNPGAHVDPAKDIEMTPENIMELIKKATKKSDG